MDLTRAGRPRVVVLGCGNPSRGDDALGPALMARVEAWTRRHPDRPVTVVEDFQLQVEHALDLQGHDLALFVDAAAGFADGVRLQRVNPSPDVPFSTHSLPPGGVLRAFVSLGWGPPPTAFSLAVGGSEFELGRPLSARARRNLDRAWRLLEPMLAHPSPSAWAARCEEGPPTETRGRLGGVGGAGPSVFR